MGLVWFGLVLAWLVLGVRVLFGCGIRNLAGSGGGFGFRGREMIWTFEREPGVMKEGIELQKFTGEPFALLLL